MALVQAIRPPEYFPRLSYAALMQASNRFIVADTFQYSRQSFQNRTKLRTPDGWQWISVPLKGGQHGRPIHEVKLDPKRAWIGKHKRSLSFNYRSTPFFEYYEPDIRAVLETERPTLAPLTVASVRLLHRLLNCSCELVILSELSDPPHTLEAARDRLELFHVHTLPDAVERNRTVFESVSTFLFDPEPYHQNFKGFEPGMTALDLIFNYGPEAARLLSRSTV